MAPTIRTGVLLLGFLLGTLEVTFWVIFYTFRVEFRQYVGYRVNLDIEEDLTALSIVVGLDLVVNIMLIAGANKDYSGRRKDLRRWGFMVPWLIVYGLNILGLFGSSIFLFYTLDGNFKLIGLIPLALSIGLLAGHITVMYFLAEQRNDQLSGACENIVDSEQSTPS